MNKYALAFSGGKDSLACYFLTRHIDPFVIWVDTGKAVPETVSIVEQIKHEVGDRFIHIRTDQQAQNDLEGLPSDLVPVDCTRIGSMMLKEPPPHRVQPYFQCCYENIGKHLQGAAKSLGATHLIRGQRLEEKHQATSRDGSLVDGVVYLHPIETWTTVEVIEYLKKHMELPEHFALGHTSLDCYDCTAYQSETQDVAEFIAKKHPQLGEIAAKRKEMLRAIIQVYAKEY